MLQHVREGYTNIHLGNLLSHVKEHFSNLLKIIACSQQDVILFVFVKVKQQRKFVVQQLCWASKTFGQIA